MSPTKRIQWLHLACLGGFVVLCCEAFWWRVLPGWADLVGVGALYVALWLETQWVRRLFTEHGDKLGVRSHQAARSMLLTRMFIVAVSVVIIAAAAGRL